MTPQINMEDGASGASPPWGDLPADVLPAITSHLGDATDFVRFHAVCRPWRGMAPPPGAPSPSSNLLLPWLIARRGFATSSLMRFRSPLSKRSMSLPQIPENLGRRLAYSDAANGLVHTSGILDPDLKDMRFCCGMRFYAKDYSGRLFNPLAAGVAVRRHEQSFVSRSCRAPNSISHSVSRYLSSDAARYLSSSSASPPTTGGEDSWSSSTASLADRLACDAMADLPLLPDRDRHVLQHRGELLCVDVLDDTRPSPRRTAADAPEALVSVRVLQVSGEDGRPRWVSREQDTRGDADDHLCLFLGWDSSFAVEARDFAGAAEEVAGGCAYFVGRRAAGKEVYCVYRYSFRDGTATVVDQLPGRFDKKSMWFIPRPMMSAVRPQPEHSTTQ